MPKDVTAPRVNRTSEIPNAHARSKVLRSLKSSAIQAKLSRRLAQKKAEAEDPSLKEERVKNNVPRTIEAEKRWAGDEDGDDRVRPVGVEVIPAGEGEGEEEEVKLDMGSLGDLFASYPPTDPSEPPPRNPVLLTTSPRPSRLTQAFAEELKGLLGGERHCEFIKRKNDKIGLGKVSGWAAGRGYGALVVIGEDRGGRNRSGPTHITISRLPYGPTSHFRLTSITPGTSIPHHARSTAHFPELVLSNFSTPLGLSIGQLLQSVWPPLPDLEGRQVVLCQNQRDFIFIRRFRYAFAERSAVFMDPNKPDEEFLRTKLQEIGPRFTLKLRWLKRGTLAGGDNLNVLPGQEGKEISRLEKEKQERGWKKARWQAEGGGAGSDDEDEDEEADQAAEAEARAELGEDVDVDMEPGPSGTTAPADPSGPSASTSAEPAAQKSKKRKRNKNSSGKTESFLRGSRSPTPEEGGGLAGFMKEVTERADIGGKGRKNRSVEWKWNARMGKDRKKMFL